MLTKVEDRVPVEDRTGVVYKIGCICGDVYNGETSRPMSTMIKEHTAACRSANFERSAARFAGWSQHRNTRHRYGLHKQTHKGSYSYKVTNNTYLQNKHG